MRWIIYQLQVCSGSESRFKPIVRCPPTGENSQKIPYFFHKHVPNPGVFLHGHKQGRSGDRGGVHGLLHLEQQLHQQPPGLALDQPGLSPEITIVHPDLAQNKQTNKRM